MSTRTPTKSTRKLRAKPTTISKRKEPSGYQKIPDELRLKIWQEASLPHGVHYFTLETPPNPTPRRNLPEIMLPITVKPLEAAQSDSSAWRVRSNIRGIDNTAWEVMAKWEKKDSIKLIGTPNTSSSNASTRVKPKGLVDTANDLVCFRWKGLVHPERIIAPEDREMLSCLKRVGLEYKMHLGSAKDYIPPFTCVCAQRPHKHLLICPLPLDYFIKYFSGADTFYFVVKLTGQMIKGEPSGPRGQKRQHGGKAKRKPAAQLISEATSHFREIALREKLEVFHDKKNTYYEMRKCDTEILTIHDHMWQSVDGARMRREARRTRDIVFFGRTREKYVWFKALLCAPT
ncbi:hypothetical protein F4677DRAFT_271867 [Hypoxylon crocopeplum]|nr:hypothetical protein F4677DRAFT_271867 [Hypoxylon crocopeplum]